MRSRARPWFAKQRRLEEYAVEVDQLEEAGRVFRVGALLGAEDWGFPRLPPSPASLAEFVEQYFGKALDAWRRELLEGREPRQLLMSPGNLAAFRRLVATSMRHSTLATGNGEAHFMGVPVRANCAHRIFRYVARRDRPVLSLRIAENARASTRPDSIRVRECTTCLAQATDEEAAASGGWLSLDYSIDGRSGYTQEEFREWRRDAATALLSQALLAGVSMTAYRDAFDTVMELVCLPDRQRRSDSDRVDALAFAFNSRIPPA